MKHNFNTLDGITDFDSLVTWLRGLQKELFEKLNRLNSHRVGSIFPKSFDDGQRYIIYQLLGLEPEIAMTINKYEDFRREAIERWRRRSNV
jgi:hypothetical protein